MQVMLNPETVLLIGSFLRALITVIRLLRRLTSEITGLVIAITGLVLAVTALVSLLTASG